MKTFAEFIDDHDRDDGIYRALKIAAQDHHQDVMSFLMRLAKQNPDIQAELDKSNHENGNKPIRRKEDRRASDVIIPNGADGASGEMPV